MDTAFAALGRFVVRFRYLIVVAWIAMTIGSVIAFPSLDSVIQNTANSDFLPANVPSIQAAQLATPFQNTGGLSDTRSSRTGTLGTSRAGCQAVVTLPYVGYPSRWWTSLMQDVAPRPHTSARTQARLPEQALAKSL